MVYGTKVLNPYRRGEEPAFKHCRWCGTLFTSLGLSRHWSKCPFGPYKNPQPRSKK